MNAKIEEQISKPNIMGENSSTLLVWPRKDKRGSCSQKHILRVSKWMSEISLILDDRDD